MQGNLCLCSGVSLCTSTSLAACAPCINCLLLSSLIEIEDVSMHLLREGVAFPCSAAFDTNIPVTEAFRIADDVLRCGVRGISDIITIPGLVNVDFADVRAVMAGAGSSLMGQGRASGKDRARDAALLATSSPLLEVGIDKATGIVWNITGPADMTLFEVST